MPEELPPPLPEGFLPRRYDDVRPLGVGGMASVHLAHDAPIGRSVVVKVLDEDRIGPSEREECRRRFVTEARAAAAIHHPNVITILDTGTGPDGRPFIVMEHMPRGSVAAWTGGALADPGTVAGWIASAARALEAAHRAGVVHRDVKPDNLLLDADGWLKVSDFGIARVRTAEDATGGTRTGIMLGTPGYMAPETWANAAAASPASDVWALAATAYRLLTGAAPFGAGFPAGAPPPASGLRPGLPAAVDPVLARGLATEPSARPDPSEFAADLATALHGATAGGETVPIPAAPAAPVPATRITTPTVPAAPLPPPAGQEPTQLVPPPPPVAPRGGRPLALGIVAVAAVLAVAVVGGVLAITSGDDDPERGAAVATRTGGPGTRAGVTTPTALGPVRPVPISGGLRGHATDSDCFHDGPRASGRLATFQPVGEPATSRDFVQCGSADDPATASRSMEFDLPDLPAGSRIVGLSGLFAVEAASARRHPAAVATWSVRIDGAEICAVQVSAEPWKRQQRCDAPDGGAPATSATVRIAQSVADATGPAGLFAGVARPRLLVRSPGS